jgi:hypothetical protein
LSLWGFSAELQGIKDFSNLACHAFVMTTPQDRDNGASKRQAKRDSLFLLADMRREDGAPLGRARVRNLSETGLMADCEGGLADGDRLVIDLRGIGEVSGSVTWVLGLRIGMAFDAQIDPRDARKPVAQTQNSLPDYLRTTSRQPLTFRR